MVNELDVKEAARLGMHTRPLTTAVVQQHLADLGVDPEFGTHSHMRGLSGKPRPITTSRVTDNARQCASSICFFCGYCSERMSYGLAGSEHQEGN